MDAALAGRISEMADMLAADGDINAERAEEMKSGAETIASRLMESGGRRLPMPLERGKNGGEGDVR